MFRRYRKLVLGLGIPAGLFLLALLESLFANAINGEIYDKLVYFFGGAAYWWDSNRPDQSDHDFFKLIYIVVSIVLTILWLLGLLHIFHLWRKTKSNSSDVQNSSLFTQVNPSLIGQEELAVAINKIGETKKATIRQEELDAVHTWMRAFEWGVANIFLLQRSEYRSYWLVRTNNNAIKHPSRLNFHDEVYGKYDNNYDVYSYFLARNSDQFKLAFIIFIHKDNVVTDERKKAFELATSSFYLLGGVDKLWKIMLQLKHRT